MKNTKRISLRIDAFVDLVFTMDCEGCLLELSPASARILGKPPAKLAGRELGKFVPSSQRARWSEFLARLPSDPTPQRLELELQGQSGPLPVELTLSAIRENDELLGFQGVIREFGRDSNQDEEQLEQNRRFAGLKDIAESLHSMASIDTFLQNTLRRLITLGRFDTGATFRRLDKSEMKRVALIGPAELFPAAFKLGGSEASLLPESYLSYPRLLASDTPVDHSLLMDQLRAKGMATTVIIPLVSHGKLRGLTLLTGQRDLALDSDMKAMLRWAGNLVGQALENQSLRETTSDLRIRFKDLTESSADHIWDVDRHGRYTYNSPSLTYSLGYRPEDVRGRRPIDFVHPDDRKDVRQYLITLQQEKKPLRGMINRVLNAEGKIVYIESRAFPVFDASGEILGYRGVDRNITDWFEAKRALETTLVGTCEALSRMVELRDPYTKGHSVRVSELMLLIGNEMGRSPYELQGLRLMGLLHDIGKIGIPSEILSKPGRLSPEELELMQQHPTRGYEILKDISFPWPVAACVLQHHERLDGSGYPQGLVSDEIIWQVRLLSVADLLEAMATDRPYRPGLGIDRAIKELQLNRGLLYDPDIVDAVLRLKDKGALTEFFGEIEDSKESEVIPEGNLEELMVEDMGHKPSDHPDYVLLSLQPDDD